MVVIVAGAIIACVYDEAAIGLGAGIPLYVIFAASLYCSSLGAARTIEERRPNGDTTVCFPDNEGDECCMGNLIFALLGGAIVMSIDEGFYKIPRLEDVVGEQKQ
ncbi:MAG: hypothetical protein KGJ02_07225 [Verrucomicrobiota bacterium]|nr:hypothetical protein [Verrucomicrobiota bacterium]